MQFPFRFPFIEKNPLTYSPKERLTFHVDSFRHASDGDSRGPSLKSKPSTDTLATAHCKKILGT